MGALYQGRCFGSATDAAGAMWSGVGPVISTGSPPVVSTVEFSTVWQVVSRQSGSVLAVQELPSVSFASCSEEAGVLDGLALGWLVVLVWVGAWAVMAMRRPLGMR